MESHKQKTEWLIKSGDILEVSADALICSANVHLNMSGGVNGAILVKHGDQMQHELRKHLSDRAISSVPPGSVVPTNPCGTPFRIVFHTVAIDLFYETSHELIVSTLDNALKMCVENRFETVALTAVGTGYGRFSIADFAKVVMELQSKNYPGLKTVTVAIQNESKAEELSYYLNNGQ